MRRRAGIVLALLLVLTGCTPAEPAGPAAEPAAEPVYMALTFDDGPSPSNTPRLLEGLSRRGVRATFFLVGSRIEGREDLDKCSRALEQVLGPGSYWLRPPYGFISQEELCALGTPAICWSVDTEDWKSRNVDSILDIVLRQAGDGDILLLHDCYPTSVTAALEIVDRLQPRGVQFVTVEELFAVKGVQPACGTLYRRVLGE